MSNSTVENVSCVNYMKTPIAPEDCEFVRTTALVFVILSIILIIWGLFNNILILVVIFSNGKKMRTVPNLVIANMAFLGVLFLVIVSGGNMLNVSQVAFQIDFHVGDSVGTALFYFQIFVAVASFTTLLVLGFDRYLAIVHPLRSRGWRTKKRAMICNCLVWIVAGLSLLPIILGKGTRDIFIEYQRSAYRTGLIIFVVFTYVIPIIILLVLYICILKVIWLHSMTKHVQGDEQERRWKQRVQVFRSVFKVIFTYVLHYGYFYAIFLWFGHGGHTKVSDRLSYCLLYSAILVYNFNTCINPLIYALYQDSFRPYVTKLLCPWRRQEQEEEGALNSSQASVSARSNTIETNASKDLNERDGQEDLFKCNPLGRRTTDADIRGYVLVNMANRHSNNGELYRVPIQNGTGHSGYSDIQYDIPSAGVNVTVLKSSVDTNKENTNFVPTFIRLKRSKAIETIL